MLLAMGLLLVPQVALSQTPASGEEAALVRQVWHNPDDQAAMVNLARLYLKTGRTAKAHNLYRQLLGMEDVALERTAGSPVSSHWLAGEALKRTGKPRDVRLSSRRN